MLGKKALLAIIALAAALVGEGAASAANANFQGNCTNSSGSSTSCQFSPNKAPAGEPFTGCNGAGVSYYLYSFGEGSYYFTYPTVDFGRAYHTYPAGPLAVTVQLEVGCNNGVVVSNSQALLAEVDRGLGLRLEARDELQAAVRAAPEDVRLAAALVRLERSLLYLQSP